MQKNKFPFDVLISPFSWHSFCIAVGAIDRGIDIDYPNIFVSKLSLETSTHTEGLRSKLLKALTFLFKVISSFALNQLLLVMEFDFRRKKKEL